MLMFFGASCSLSLQPYIVVKHPLQYSPVRSVYSWCYSILGSWPMCSIKKAVGQAVQYRTGLNEASQFIDNASICCLVANLVLLTILCVSDWAGKVSFASSSEICHKSEVLNRWAVCPALLLNTAGTDSMTSIGIHTKKNTSISCQALGETYTIR